MTIPLNRVFGELPKDVVFREIYRLLFKFGILFTLYSYTFKHVIFVHGLAL